MAHPCPTTGEFEIRCSSERNISEPDADVGHTFTPDRSDQPFGKAVLPGRGGCGRLVPDAHGTQSPCDDHTVDAILVPDHVARSRVPGECLGDLSRDPFGGRMCRDIDPDKISAV